MSNQQHIDISGHTPVTGRVGELVDFFRLVLTHVIKYTIPQYGDMPNDPLSGYTIQGIKIQLERYVNRIGSNARGPAEALRDCLKIAHYACVLRSKILEEEEENDNGE